MDVGSTPTVSTNKKARKGHFLLVEKGRKEATGINENVEISGFFYVVRCWKVWEFGGFSGHIFGNRTHFRPHYLLVHEGDEAIQRLPLVGLINMVINIDGGFDIGMT